MKIKSLLCLVAGLTIILSSCGNDNNTKGNYGRPVDTTHGKPVALVQLWSITCEGPETGLETFSLYKDNGCYYVEFYGRYYQLSRVRPFSAGDTILTYGFTTVEGYQYYLEDVTDDETWFFDMRYI